MQSIIHDPAHKSVFDPGTLSIREGMDMRGSVL